MKVHSGHIYLSEKLDWKDLKKVFPEKEKVIAYENRRDND